MSIKIFYDKIEFRLKRSGEIKKFLEKVILAENKLPGDLNFIFTNDKSLLEMNIRFLGHDYNTDVIAFDYHSEDKLNGEVYISLETVEKNAAKYKVKKVEEVVRVMIHATLHLCGYSDANREGKDRMFQRQEKYLEELGRIV